MATFRVLYKTGAGDQIEASDVRDPGGSCDADRFTFIDAQGNSVAVLPAKAVLSIIRLTPHESAKFGDFSWEMVEDGLYEAASKVCDDGAPFRWRIGLSDKSIGAFVLDESDSELFPDGFKGKPFGSFQEAEAFAARLEAGLLATLKREEEEAEAEPVGT